MKTTFKLLPTYAQFEFDHSHLASWSGAVGPWYKLSPRLYAPVSNPQHTVHRVGKTSIAVIRLPKS